MGIPFGLAMASIPWEAILRRAPLIVKAVDALWAGVKNRKQASKPILDLQHLSDRITALEKYDQADAEVLEQISKQIASLTAATESMAARLRLFFVWCSILSVIIVVILAKLWIA